MRHPRNGTWTMWPLNNYLPTPSIHDLETELENLYKPGGVAAMGAQQSFFRGARVPSESWSQT